MAEQLHLVYTAPEEGYQGWMLSSPQVPTLAAGRNSLPELYAAANDLLEFAEAPIRDQRAPGVYVHQQHLVVDPSGNEYLIRWQFDEDVDIEDDPRYETASRLHASVLEGREAEDLDRSPQLATGERLLIVVLPSDRIDWIEEQLRDNESATLSMHRGDGALWSIPFGEELDLPGKRSAESLGLSPDDTFADLLDAVISSEANDLVQKRIETGHAALGGRMTPA